MPAEGEQGGILRPDQSGAKATVQRCGDTLQDSCVIRGLLPLVQNAQVQVNGKGTVCRHPYGDAIDPQQIVAPRMVPKGGTGAWTRCHHINQSDNVYVYYLPACLARAEHAVKVLKDMRAVRN